MSKPKLATVWLDGCSGCHMSILDMDERLVELAEQFDLVYSPLVDYKEFPAQVDIALIEGSVSSDEDEHKIRYGAGTHADSGFSWRLRRNRQCARDAKSHSRVRTVRVAFTRKTVCCSRKCRRSGLPSLLPRVRPVHEVVNVDVFVPGCPPSADTIYAVISELLAGRVPDVAALSRFGVTS